MSIIFNKPLETFGYANYLHTVTVMRRPAYAPYCRIQAGAVSSGG
jgi:hypothetical protein